LFKIFFGKVENDGFDLGAQRREIDKNDIPILTYEVNQFLNGLRNGDVKSGYIFVFLYLNVFELIESKHQESAKMIWLGKRVWESLLS
jgi:hypothetical protein